MIEVVPSSHFNRCSYYFALEEFILKHLPEQEYFFLWHIDPSIVVGKHQLIENEVDLAYAKEHHVAVYRRPSGGGAVYADRGCRMFSFVSPNFDQQMVFHTYLKQMIEVLKSLKLDVVFSGRNDLLLDGKKFSGNAFYRYQNKAVLHGTILYDMDFEAMMQALHPPMEKYIYKGVQSIRQRVINLKPYLSIDLEQFCQYLIDNLCDSHYYLSREEETLISQYEQSYLQSQWIYGKNPSFDVVKSGRTKAGLLEFHFDVKQGVIRQCRIFGDYFALQDITLLETAFQGIPYSNDSWQSLISSLPLEQFIKDIEKEEVINILR